VVRWANAEHGVYSDFDREVYLGMGVSHGRARRSSVRMQQLLSTNWTAEHDIRLRDPANNFTLRTDYVLEDALFYERLFAYLPVSDRTSAFGSNHMQNYID
jgi:hypothetical protein